MKKAVCLLSGGIDSATTAALAKAEGWEILALTVDYGQRHRREIEAAGRIAASLKAAEHVLLEVNLRAWGGSALTSEDIAVPSSGRLKPGFLPPLWGRMKAGGATPTLPSPMEGGGEPMMPAASGPEIPATYVPARNLVLLSLALSFAEARGAQRVYFGANSLDYSGYPDCRPEFVEAFSQAATLGTRVGVEGRPIEILAPLQHLTKTEILRRGLELGVDYSLTWSCYRGEEAACGECDSCRIRLAAFAALGTRDPASYASINTGSDGGI